MSVLERCEEISLEKDVCEVSIELNTCACPMISKL